MASNGAVVFRYPPLEVVMEETFDAAPAVQAILERHPTALVAVEERGVGYRVSKEFPTGELSGEMIVTDLDDLVAAPVSRVIIRDPDATADDFVALAAGAGPARHRLRRRLDGLARPRPGRGAPRPPASPTSRSSSASTPPTCSPSATAATTSRCSEWAGRGVAMGQAVQLVLDSADDVTASVADDGAAVELGRYFSAPLRGCRSAWRAQCACSARRRSEDAVSPSSSDGNNAMCVQSVREAH